jgi:hypothetical protein
MSDKVERAVVAAQAVSPQSGFIPDEALFSNDISEITIDENGNAHYSHRVDTSKRDALLEILRPLNLNDESRQLLLQRTQGAVIDFTMALLTPKRSEQKKRLEKFVAAMTVAAQAWKGLGHDLQDSVLTYLEKNAPTLETTEDEFLARLDRSHRIRQSLTDDVYTASLGARKLVEIISADQSHSPPEYALIIRVCIAWQDCTGRAPTLSRNINETRGERIVTPFERFVNAAIAPHRIGERVIRGAWEAFVAGRGDKPAPKIG